VRYAKYAKVNVGITDVIVIAPPRRHTYGSVYLICG